MKKAIKIVLSVLLSILTVLLVAGWILNEPRPEGISGPQAEALADSMLQAVNYDGFLQTKVIEWTYERGDHHYVWDREGHSVNVRWGDYNVDFFPDTKLGTGERGGVPLEGSELEKAIQKAWEYFANDSFWLVAPFKIRDPGTQRAVVQTEKGQALLVTYTSGGVTPGDSYLWHLDEDYMPVSWQMWVSILPIGGLELTWEGWEVSDAAKFATMHKGPGGLVVQIKDLFVK